MTEIKGEISFSFELLPEIWAKIFSFFGQNTGREDIIFHRFYYSTILVSLLESVGFKLIDNHSLSGIGCAVGYSSYEDISFKELYKEEYPSNSVLYFQREEQKVIVLNTGEYPGSIRLVGLKDVVKKINDELLTLGKKKYRIRRINNVPFENNTKWENIILDKDLKSQLYGEVNTFIQHYELCQKNKLAQKRGILLHGLPGNGKTLIAGAIANMCDWDFTWVKLDDIDHDTKEMLEDINNAKTPQIVFFDDVDLIFQERDRGGSLTGTFMTWLDGVGQCNTRLVVAATNELDKVENAISSRPGRFDSIYEVLPPKDKERKALIDLYSNTMILDNVNIDEIIEKTKNYSCASIREVVNRAGLYAIEENSVNDDRIVIIKHDHLIKSVEGLVDYHKREEKRIGLL